MSSIKSAKRKRADSLPPGDVKAAKVACAPPPPPPPSYEIHYLNGGRINTPQEVVIGDQVQLRLVGINGGVVTNPVWNITNHHVGSYTNLSNNIPAATPNAQTVATVLNAAPITFHWISAGNKNVSVTADLNGVPNTAPTNDNLTFDVIEPTIHEAKVDLTTVPRILTTPDGHALVLRTATRVAGAKFLFRVSRFTGAQGTVTTGRIAGIQLVRTNDYWIADISQTPGGWNYNLAHRTGPAAAPGVGDDYMKEELASSQGQYYLDTRAPYGTVRNLGVNTVWREEDSPNSPLHASLTKVQADDQFDVYFMFRSSNPNSIWVTLRQLQWQWRATVERPAAAAGNPWLVAHPILNSLPPNAQTIPAIASHTLPIWNGVADGNSIDFVQYTNNPHL